MPYTSGKMNQVNICNDLPGIDVEQDPRLAQMPHIWQSEHSYDSRYQYEGPHAHVLSMKNPYHHGLGFSVKQQEPTIYVESLSPYATEAFEEHFHGYSRFSIGTGLPTPIDSPLVSCDDNDTESTTSRSQMWSVSQPEDLVSHESGLIHHSQQWSMAPGVPSTYASASPNTPAADNFVAMNQLFPENQLSTTMLVDHCDGGTSTPVMHSIVEHPFHWSEPEAHASPASEAEDEDDEDFSSDSLPETPSDDEDGTYNPHGKAKSSHKRRGSGSGRKQPTARRNTAHRRASSGSVRNAAGSGRGFPCPLAHYGCIATFASKNEWKRHVATQHVKLGFWRCDLCPATNSGHNDFNRKDLFTQHLKRMHRQYIVDTYDQEKLQLYPDIAKIPDNELKDATEPLVKLCLRELRQAPTRCKCLFCDRTFKGPQAWESRMEHIATHLERSRKTGGKVPAVHEWRADEELEIWLEQEGLIAKDAKGQWQIGDGIPIRGDKRLKR